jgi:multiple antibiotic resistance protein
MAIALVVMTDAIGTAPLFLALTSQHAKSRVKIALLASLTAVVTLLASAYFGDMILKVFGISVSSFRVIGGILFLLMSIDMLNAKQSRTKHTPEEDAEAVSKRELAIVPIGIPFLAGPGAISSVLIFMSRTETPMDKLWVSLVIVLTCAVSFSILAGSVWIAPRLGKTGMNVLTRLMGLILGAVAVEMLVGGLKEMVPVLNSPPSVATQTRQPVESSRAAPSGRGQASSPSDIDKNAKEVLIEVTNIVHEAPKRPDQDRITVEYRITNGLSREISLVLGDIDCFAKGAPTPDSTVFEVIYSGPSIKPGGVVDEKIEINHVADTVPDRVVFKATQIQ